VKAADVAVTVGGALRPTPVGVAPTLIAFALGGSSRLKYVVPPGGTAGEKLTLPELVSVEMFV
jgi:hypothetical protein